LRGFSQQRTVRRYADIKTSNFIRAFGERFLPHIRHRRIATGNHNLGLGIQIGNIRPAPFHQCFHLRQRQAHDRRQTITVRPGLFHQITAQSHKPQGICIIQRPAMTAAGYAPIDSPLTISGETSRRMSSRAQATPAINKQS
jgi:hypothetical protein